MTTTTAAVDWVAVHAATTDASAAAGAVVDAIGNRDWRTADDEILRTLEATNRLANELEHGCPAAAAEARAAAASLTAALRALADGDFDRANDALKRWVDHLAATDDPFARCLDRDRARQ